MLFTVPTDCQPQTADQINNLDLLRRYLHDVRHADLDLLDQQTTQAIIQDSYQQFYTFMQDSMPHERWYSLFRQYVYETMHQLGRDQWQADWVMRSIEFSRFCASQKSLSESSLSL